jgi:uncharacterized RDD family membrane protein YckC
MAPRALRLAAFFLDALLAILLAAALRLLFRLGILPEWGSWSVYHETPRIEPQFVGVCLILLACRDVLWGSSPAKWLLSLRLVTADGGRLTVLQRLLRAPFSLLPLGLMRRSVQDALPWNVVSYTPGRVGLLVRTAATAFAATFSLLWAIETIRPSIPRKHAETLASSLVSGDLLLRQQLGTPLVTEIGDITRRAHQHERGHLATFALAIHGPLGRQEMTVVARKVDGIWRLSELRDIVIVLRADADRVAEGAAGSGAVAPE